MRNWAIRRWLQGDDAGDDFINIKIQLYATITILILPQTTHIYLSLTQSEPKHILLPDPQLPPNLLHKVTQNRRATAQTHHIARNLPHRLLHLLLINEATEARPVGLC